jgi:hypothetical protein
MSGYGRISAAGKRTVLCGSRDPKDFPPRVDQAVAKQLQHIRADKAGRSI